MANKSAAIVLPAGLEWFGKRKKARFPLALKLGIGLVMAAPFLGIGGIVIHSMMTQTPPSSSATPAPAASAAAAVAGAQPASADPSISAPLVETQAQDQPAAPSGPVTGYEQDLAAAKTMLQSRLPENKGLVYREVRTVLKSQEGQDPVTFCGQLNMLNPAGAYTGFQRFVSSSSAAVVEENMTPGDFAAAWSARCAGRTGPEIWR